MNSIDVFSFFPFSLIFRQKEWMALELCWIFLRSLLGSRELCLLIFYLFLFSL